MKPLLAAQGPVLFALLLSSCQAAATPTVESVGSQMPVSTSAIEETPEASAGEPLPEVPASAATPMAFAFPTPGPNPVSAWRPPPYPVPWAVRPADHFYFLRPIPSGNVNWPHPRYRYGNTFFGEESIHTGVDLDAPRDTPVLAAGSGRVTWVGFGLYGGAYNPKDPYGLAVLIRHDFGQNGRPLYTVYGHLSKAFVWQGQRVEAGEEIGLVGETGNAEGPHLHFEVRFAQDGYFTTRNPELWMVPPEGWGVLAGLVADTYGRALPEQLVQIRSLETGQRWDVWTYATETVHPDDVYGENFVISDLPAGPYEVQIDFGGHSYTAQLLVRAGQTNFLKYSGRKGFIVEPTPTAAPLLRPPTS